MDAIGIVTTHAEDCVRRQREWRVPKAYVGALVADFSAEDFDAGCDTEWMWCGTLGAPRSIFASGANGTGKTHLAAALIGEWGGAWTTAADLMLRISSSWRRGAEECEEYIVRDLCSRRLLVIDDITAIARTERGMSIMLQLVSRRMDAVLPTIVTAFQGLAAIDALDSSLASRLASFHQLRLVGADRRLR